MSSFEFKKEPCNPVDFMSQGPYMYNVLGGRWKTIMTSDMSEDLTTNLIKGPVINYGEGGAGVCV